MNDTIRPLTSLSYGTMNSENIAATRNNCITTLRQNGTTASKLERVPSEDIVDFKTNKKQEIEKEASTLKKLGVGTASFIVPGVGQAINGQWGKALGFFTSAVAAGGLVLVSPLLAAGAGLGIGILSAVDAAKNAKG